MDGGQAAQDIDFSEVFAMERIGFNARRLNFCRVFVASIAGMAAGIMGITGIPGFLAFFLSTFLLSVGLYLKVSMEPKPTQPAALATTRTTPVTSITATTPFTPPPPRSSLSLNA